MSRSAPTLQAVLSVVTMAVTTLALAIAISLLVVTSNLHQASMSLADSVESLGLADEAEIDLLLHDRAPDAPQRRQIEESLRSKLNRAGRYADHPNEVVQLGRVRKAVELYLTVAGSVEKISDQTLAPLEAAYQALEVMVEMNVAESRAARERATHWEAVANRLGITIGAAVFLFSGWLLWWLKFRAFRPVLALARSLEQFAKGDREARAEETGPGELRDMARRFNEMATALASQRQAQMSFLGGVAHDFRNPLSALRLSVELIRPDLPLPPEPKIRRTVALVARQVAHLERMVGDFLDMARIEAGQLELQFEVGQAVTLVREVVELFEGTSSQHPLVVTVPPRDIFLRCDPVRMGQVLSNLVSNAIKYSADGGSVEVALALEAGQAVLSVTDHGIGISAEDQARLFEPFRRVGTSMQTIPGVGLGLFVARQIVRAHGGRMEVRSVVGMGTTMRIHMPTVHMATATQTVHALSPDG